MNVDPVAIAAEAVGVVCCSDSMRPDEFKARFVLTSLHDAGVRVQIGATHHRCRTCGGSGRAEYGTAARSGSFKTKPCPDGAPVYWTPEGT